MHLNFQIAAITIYSETEKKLTNVQEYSDFATVRVFHCNIILDSNKFAIRRHLLMHSDSSITVGPLEIVVLFFNQLIPL